MQDIRGILAKFDRVLAHSELVPEIISEVKGSEFHLEQIFEFFAVGVGIF
jgi:hypothetical protein